MPNSKKNQNQKPGRERDDKSAVPAAGKKRRLSDNVEDLKEEEQALRKEQDEIEDEFVEVGMDPRGYEDKELKSYGYGDDGLSYSDEEDENEGLQVRDKPDEDDVKEDEDDI